MDREIEDYNTNTNNKDVHYPYGISTKNIPQENLNIEYFYLFKENSIMTLVTKNSELFDGDVYETYYDLKPSEKTKFVKSMDQSYLILKEKIRK